MEPKTARKYLRSGKLPSEIPVDRTGRTREDPFNDVWESLREQLTMNPGLEATGRFADGH